MSLAKIHLHMSFTFFDRKEYENDMTLHESEIVSIDQFFTLKSKSSTGAMDKNLKGSIKTTCVNPLGGTLKVLHAFSFLLSCVI